MASNEKFVVFVGATMQKAVYDSFDEAIVAAAAHSDEHERLEIRTVDTSVGHDAHIFEQREWHFDIDRKEWVGGGALSAAR